MKFQPLLLISLFLFCLFSLNVRAITLNSNFNFTTEEEAHNGLFFISQDGNTSCFSNYNLYYPLWFINELNQTTAYTNYSDCSPNQYQTIYFYPLDNSKSTIFHASAGLIIAEVRFFLQSNGAYVFNDLKPANLKIRNANNGFIYNQTNLSSSDIANASVNWLPVSVSYNLTNSTDIQIVLVFDDFYNYYGVNYFIKFYFDYFKVSGTSCVPQVYCINDYDYKVVSSSCLETIATCSPKICRNFLNYSLSNITSVKGIGCFDNQTLQTTSCRDQSNKIIDCNILEPGTTNYGDSIALALVSFLGIKDLALAHTVFSLIIALIVGVVIAMLLEKDRFEVFLVSFSAVILIFTLISWFPSWLMVVLIVIAGAIVSGVLRDIFGG